MPYRITWEADGAYSQFWGEVNLTQILAMLEDVGGDSRFDGIYYLLADYTEVTQPGVTSDDAVVAAAIGQAQRLSNPYCLRAAVAKNEEGLAILKSWFSFYKDPWNIGYFSSITEARAWIEARKGHCGTVLR